MNRRSFLTSLGTAALGAAALAIDDPDRLLWIPGAKTIVDFGATKQVVPATDAEVVNHARLAKQIADRIDDEAMRAFYSQDIAFATGEQWPIEYRIERITPHRTYIDPERRS